MSLDLDQEETLIQFNGESIDLTDIKEDLIEKSGYFKTLFEDCDDDIVIDTSIISNEDLKEALICLSSKYRTYPVMTMDRLSKALNYLSIDKEIVDHHHKIFSRRMKKKDLDVEELIAVFRYFRERNDPGFENILNDYDENVVSEMKKGLAQDEYLDLHFVWRQLHKKIDKMIVLYDFNKDHEKRDRLLLDIHDFDIEYEPIFDPFLKADTEHQRGDKLILDREESIDRFHKESFGILEDLSFDNIVVAGGYALYSVSPKLRKENTDVDIFVYGSKDERETAFIRVLSYFKSYADREDIKIFFAKQWKVVTVCLEEIKINFQMIFTDCLCKYDVIDHFDMDFSRILFDGEKFYCNDNTIRSLKAQCLLIPCRTKPSRYLKAYKKGFSIKHDIGTTMEEIEKDEKTIKKLNSFHYPESKHTSEETIAILKKRFNTDEIFLDIDGKMLEFGPNRQRDISYLREGIVKEVSDLKEITDSIRFGEEKLIHHVVPMRRIYGDNRHIAFTLPISKANYTNIIPGEFKGKIDISLDTDAIDKITRFEDALNDKYIVDGYMMYSVQNDSLENLAVDGKTEIIERDNTNFVQKVTGHNHTRPYSFIGKATIVPMFVYTMGHEARVKYMVAKLEILSEWTTLFKTQECLF